jgi:hypothetical protein
LGTTFAGGPGRHINKKRKIMKFNSTELVAWFNHRVYPMIALVITHFILGGILIAAYGVAGPDSGLPLFIISVAESLLAVLFIVSTVDDMRRLFNDSTDEFKATNFGGGFTGFVTFGVIFSILILAVTVAHGILFL